MWHDTCYEVFVEDKMVQNNVKRSRVRVETARLQRVRVTEGVSTGARVMDRELIASSKPVEDNYSC